AADRKLAFQSLRALGERAWHVAAHDTHWAGVETVRGNSVFNGQDCGQRLEFSLYARSPQPCCFLSCTQHAGDCLLMKSNFRGEERLIVAGGAGVAFAGDIGGGQGGAYPWLGQGRSGVQCCQSSMSMRRKHWPR